MVVLEKILHRCAALDDCIEANDVERSLHHCVKDALVGMQNQSWYSTLFNTDSGKMFGVLLIETENGPAYLLGFSGMLSGQWLRPGFVPPVFDMATALAILSKGEAVVAELDAKLSRSELVAQCQVADKQLALFDANMNTELSYMQYRLARRRRHRHMHRTWLTEAYNDKSASQHLLDDQEDTPTVQRQIEHQLAQLDKQSKLDKKERKLMRRYWQQLRQKLCDTKQLLETERQAIFNARARVSSQTQTELFNCYSLSNPTGKSVLLSSLFTDGQPPGGAGDCAAPKLLHYANSNGLRVLSLTEFWVGASPRSGVRQHGLHYPPCRAKCGPLMRWLTSDTSFCPIETRQYGTAKQSDDAADNLDIIYDDACMAVINKPPGLLSTPGKTIKDSVYSRFASQFPTATGPLLVHRLDMDTSGLLLLAKNAAAHKALQAQFIKRTIEKRYKALLDGNISADSGTVSLPLRVDLDDRPRQLVCDKHGKTAQTLFTVLSREHGMTRVDFEPITGRTHQLRVHAAHVRGLNAPIVGDPLYGRSDTRMMLHAEAITFRHPDSGKRVSLSSPVPF